MRIALIGQAAFAVKALEEVERQGDEIVHVFAPADRGGRADPLALRARERGLALSQPTSFKGDGAFQQFAALNADLAILAFATIIVPERILYLPRYKSICFHPSLLPRHRGASAINWAIINGERETGVTWFWPDKGIDTGPILIQKAVPIGPADTTGALYFNSLFPLGIQTLGEALQLIKTGQAPALAQDETKASYEPPCRDEHAAVDFSQGARAIFNLIRGCDPQPGAYAQLDGHRIRLYEAALGEATVGAGPPGTIVSLDGGGLRLALADGSVVVKRVRVDSASSKVAPSELPPELGLAVGRQMQGGA